MLMAGGDAAGTDPSCFMSHMSAGLPHGSINQEILHQQLNSIPPSKFSCYKQRQQEHRLTHLRQKEKHSADGCEREKTGAIGES